MLVFPLNGHSCETDVKNSRFIAEILPITDPEITKIRQQALKEAIRAKYRIGTADAKAASERRKEAAAETSAICPCFLSSL